MSRRRPSLINGFFVVDKPLEMSSNRAMTQVRIAAGNNKTGHAGTLDPLATGVLVCCLGRATKEVEKIMGMPKVYEATVDLSAFTASDDAEQEREEVVVEQVPTLQDIKPVCDSLTGEVKQRPSHFSALKVNGQPAYKLARKGIAVDIPERTVQIYSLEILSYEWPFLAIRVHCGRGTYIRTLARQIGTALGTGGYLTALRRTRVGVFCLDNSSTLDDLPDPITQDHLLPIDIVQDMADEASQQTAAELAKLKVQ